MGAAEGMLLLDRRRGGGAATVRLVASLALALLLALVGVSIRGARGLFEREEQKMCATVGTEKYGDFDGSEDGSIWRDGLVLFSPGMSVLRAWPGFELVNLTGKTPSARPVPLLEMPRPERRLIAHGFSIDNSTNRVYLLTHDVRSVLERVLVFDIVGDCAALRFRFALWSPFFQPEEEDSDSYDEAQVTPPLTPYTTPWIEASRTAGRPHPACPLTRVRGRLPGAAAD